MTAPKSMKRRPGRPRVEDKRRKRALSMSDSEWNLLKDRAGHAGLSVSGFVRLRCLQEGADA